MEMPPEKLRVRNTYYVPAIRGTQGVTRRACACRAEAQGGLCPTACRLVFMLGRALQYDSAGFSQDADELPGVLIMCSYLLP
jgi:hypothetical protein